MNLKNQEELNSGYHKDKKIVSSKQRKYFDEIIHYEKL